MRHRIYTHDPLAGLVTIRGEELHHAARVVRVHEGEEVELFDGEGRAAAGIVQSIEHEQMIVRIEKPIDSRESPVAIDLAMAIIQLEKFELVLQKATELGVRSIIPMTTDRVEVRPERYRGKHERWGKIIFEATKQSGRSVIAKLEAPTTFDEVVQRKENKILFDAEADPTQHSALGTQHLLLIGPEGGWTPRELELARESGCAFEQLGPRRLRAETAAIVACARHNDRFTNSEESRWPMTP
jgi:16S rRNA (uracil1498-N3)-methyltransferase